MTAYIKNHLCRLSKKGTGVFVYLPCCRGEHQEAGSSLDAW